MLIDYPGFNLRLARALAGADCRRSRSSTTSARRSGPGTARRIPQMARYLDLMLCIFPFEAELYNKSGLRTVFVGHPMLEALKGKRTNGERNAESRRPVSRQPHARNAQDFADDGRRSRTACDQQTATLLRSGGGIVATRRRDRDACSVESRVPADSSRITTGEASDTMQRAQRRDRSVRNGDPRGGVFPLAVRGHLSRRLADVFRGAGSS